MKDNFIMCLNRLLVLLLLMPIVNCRSGLNPNSSNSPQAILENIIPYGQVYYKLDNSKGLVLCFHGTGGGANGWTSKDKLKFLKHLSSQGYGFICPSSVDRNLKQWDNTNSSANLDVQNIENILFHFGVPPSMKIFLVGHSNGGGFVSRFSVFSSLTANVSAVQYSNSSGIDAILSDVSYVFPSLFSYADCDPIVNATDVRNNQTTLTSKVPPVFVLDNDIDAIYSGGGYADCHEFANTGITTANFFNSY